MERATEIVRDFRTEDPNDVSVISRVARQLGVGCQSLRNWAKWAQADAGSRPGLTSDERDDLKRLRNENHVLQRTTDILQAAAVFFRALRPPTEEVAAFIDGHRDNEFGRRQFARRRSPFQFGSSSVCDKVVRSSVTH